MKVSASAYYVYARGKTYRETVVQKAMIHTDRGSQYASVEYRRLLCINGFRQSMSGKGNCYDNAQAESFFSRFKAELVEEVRSEVSRGLFSTSFDSAFCSLQLLSHVRCRAEIQTRYAP